MRQNAAKQTFKRTFDRAKNMTGDALQGNIDAARAHLEKTAADMGTQLSLDLSSVQVLEEILTALKDFDADTEVLKGAGFLVGAYLGEVRRRELGGEWVVGTNGDDFAVKAGGLDVFPVARTRKFIADPSASGLVFFAEALVSQHGTARP